MAKPTKEQIEDLLRRIRKDHNVVGFSTIFGLMDLGYDSEDITGMLITEWEKIRNSPK